jgi:alpha-tubulin suppressor-like RCC1 family protein
LKLDGSLWAWGENDLGQLGDGTNTNRNTPICIGTHKNWMAISAGNKHTIALKTNGSIWAWGWNDSGVLGIFTQTWRTNPVRVITDINNGKLNQFVR